MTIPEEEYELCLKFWCHTLVRKRKTIGCRKLRLPSISNGLAMTCLCVIVGRIRLRLVQSVMGCSEHRNETEAY
jgi:hypothetical protein